MADKGGLQLLPETRKRIDVKTPGENRLLVVGVLALLIVGGIQFGLLTYISSMESAIDGLNTDIKDLENQRDRKTEAALFDISKQSALVSGALGNHIYMSQAYERVSELLQVDTQLISLSFSVPTQRIEFIGRTSTYVSLARQLSVLINDEGIRDAQLNSIQAGNDGSVGFTMSILVNADHFFKNK